jgi:hypothetical protein
VAAPTVLGFVIVQNTSRLMRSFVVKDVKITVTPARKPQGALRGYLIQSFPALAFPAGLVAPLAGASSDARRARVLSRLAACDRLRVFFRALVFGMARFPHLSELKSVKGIWLPSYARIAKIAGIAKIDKQNLPRRRGGTEKALK